jgi:hypothetical protein
MPDFSMNLQYPQQPQMSLGDMLNLARGAQAYQQSQQLNPLQIETARIQQQKLAQELGQAQQLNPLQLKKAAEELTTAQEQAKQNVVKTLSDTQAQKANQFNAIAGSQVSLINNPLVVRAEEDPKSLTHLERLQLGNLFAQTALNTSHAKGISEKDALDQINPMIEKILSDPSSIRQDLKQLHIQTLDNASRTTALTPSGIAVNYGSGGQVTSTNPFSQIRQGQAIPGTQYTQGLAPSVQTSETQAPFIMGGQQGGIANTPQPPMMRPNAPQAPQGIMPGLPQGMLQGQTNAPTGLVNQVMNKGGIQISPGESYESYRDRVAKIAALPNLANQSLNIANPESVPNMMDLNKKVLGLLDKGVEVGPVAQIIADKTANVSLTPEQQEIRKYLEQRIRQESARSNQDQSSQRQAFGSFGVDQDALRSILYRDNGRLTAQHIFMNGIKNNQGNINSPDLGKVNTFVNEFTRISQDPKVTQLMGVLGDKKITELSKSELKHLQGEFGNLSKEKLQDLLDKRNELIRLSTGK